MDPTRAASDYPWFSRPELRVRDNFFFCFLREHLNFSYSGADIVEVAPAYDSNGMF
jgi:hypothetical protein